MRLVIYILVSKHYFAAKFTEYYSIRLLRFLVKGEWKGKKPSVYVCLFVFLFYLEKLINLGEFGSVVSVLSWCHVWSLKQAEEVCVDLHALRESQQPLP